MLDDPDAFERVDENTMVVLWRVGHDQYNMLAWPGKRPAAILSENFRAYHDQENSFRWPDLTKDGKYMSSKAKELLKDYQDAQSVIMDRDNDPVPSTVILGPK